jgi:UDP-N-acetylglucosamine:LPS N-acetylglucosamine transferase
MAARDAIVELPEAHAEQEQRLGRTVADLLDNTKRRQQLAKNLHALAHPGSAHELAQLIIATGEKKIGI